MGAVDPLLLLPPPVGAAVEDLGGAAEPRMAAEIDLMDAGVAAADLGAVELLDPVLEDLGAVDDLGAVELPPARDPFAWEAGEGLLEVVELGEAVLMCALLEEGSLVLLPP